MTKRVKSPLTLNPLKVDSLSQSVIFIFGGWRRRKLALCCHGNTLLIFNTYPIEILRLVDNYLAVVVIKIIKP